MNIDKFFMLIISVILFIGCNEKVEDSINYANIPTFSDEEIVNAVIEIPTGTNHKNEYNYSNNAFSVDKNDDGTDRIIKFLGYPGNYGFIPSTLMDEERGGDGDALDILVLAEALPVASIVKVKIIGVMKLIDNGEQDDKIIAIPIDKDKQIISVDSVEELSGSVRLILQEWFLNYKQNGKIEFVSWQNAEEAKALIKFWQINP